MKKLLLAIMLITTLHANNWETRFTTEMDKCADAKKTSEVSCIIFANRLAARISHNEKQAIDTSYLCATACADPKYYYASLRDN